MQIRDKLIAGETSRLYCNKVGELLSIVASNFHKQRQEIASKQQPLSKQEKKGALRSVRQAIEQNVLNPPEVSQLCKIAAMGQTKLRESFQSPCMVFLLGLISDGKNAVCAFIDVKTEFDNRQYCRAFGLCQCK